MVTFFQQDAKLVHGNIAQVNRLAAFPLQAHKLVAFVQFTTFRGWAARLEIVDHYATVLIGVSFKTKLESLVAQGTCKILLFLGREECSMRIETRGNGFAIHIAYIMRYPVRVLQY